MRKQNHKRLNKIKKTSLPKNLSVWVEEYKGIDGERTYIFPWLFLVIEMTRLKEISETEKAKNLEVKFLTSMFIILIDDVADKIKDQYLLETVLSIPGGNEGLINLKIDAQREYYKFTKKVWTRIAYLMKALPRYNDYKEIFQFDITQLLNGMRYSLLLNKDINLLNIDEYWLYSGYSEQAMLCFMTDIMSIDGFDKGELGLLREVALLLQKTTRIGDCLSSWEKEVEERDYSNGVIAYAHAKKIITKSEIINKDCHYLIKKIKNSNIEKNLCKEWQKTHKVAIRKSLKLDSIDGKYISAMPKKIFKFHMAIKGKR